MTTKTEAIAFAQEFKWTAKDAERAFVELKLKDADKQELLLALVRFAGPELLQRQYLQGAQKGQVTTKAKYIKKIELEFAETVGEYEEKLKQERSTFVNLIARLYQIAKRLGFEDPWIEALLSKYNEYQQSA